MKRLFVAAITLILMVSIIAVLGSPAWAGWNEAMEAHDSGDYRQAFAEFKSLAEQGLARAQAKASPGDTVRALMWFFDLAADQNRGTAAELMTPDEIREAKRPAVEWTAAHRRSE